jgi:Skp family chaperone for outer membrane proteins
MKFPRFLCALSASLLLSGLSPAQEGEDKIGTVDMSRLVMDYHKSESTRETFKTFQDSIKDLDKVRLEKIKASSEEAEKFSKDANDPSLSGEKRDMLFKQASAKRNEAESLQKDRISWLKRKQSQLNEKAAMDFGDIREELLMVVKAVGEEQGFDFIFDRSGASAAGVAVLVYTKDATDLTGILLERINKDAPEEKKDE